MGGEAPVSGLRGRVSGAEIFLNGKKVGAHKGGYTGFEIDITGSARSRETCSRWRLNNLWNAQLTPRAGEHVFSGGLYRNVWLVAVNPLHVCVVWHFVTTPKVSTESATVNVKTEVVNQSATPKSCALRSDVLDAAGQVVASMNSTPDDSLRKNGDIRPDERADRESEAVVAGTPTLFNRVVSTLLDGKTLRTASRRRLAFVSIQWTADKAFFLNGQHRYFKARTSIRITRAGATR